MSIINSINIFTPLGRELQPATHVARKSGKTDEAVAGACDMELLNSKMNISRLYDMMSAVPDVREWRVEQALFSIVSGAYGSVNAEQIAEKIIKGDILNELI